MTNPSVTPRRRWRRRLGIAVAVVLLGALAFVAAVPRLLGTERARRVLLKQANAVLAPGGGLQVARFRFSWFGPTRMAGFTILDAEGQRVVEAPEAVLDRSLAGLLFDRPRFGTLTLDNAALDVDRRPDGSIDLADAIKPILATEPGHPPDDPRSAGNA